jgi:hypothetical protein
MWLWFVRFDRLNITIGIHAGILIPSTLHPRIARISHYRQKPRAAILSAKICESPQCPQACFLDYILGIVAISREPSREVIGFVKMAKRLLPKSFHKLRIHDCRSTFILPTLQTPYLFPFLGRSCAKTAIFI